MDAAVADPFAGGANPFAVMPDDDGSARPAATARSPVAPSGPPADLVIRARPSAGVPGGADRAAGTTAADPFANGQNPFANMPDDDGSGSGPAAASRPSIVSGTVRVAPERPEGGLTNTGDEGFFSGLAKGTATAAIKGISNSLGVVGNMGNIADYLVARGESAWTGRDPAEIMAEIQKQKQDHAPKGLPSPASLLPSGEQMAAPILKHTGEYEPDSWPGRLAQAGATAVFGSIGPGAGAVAPGTAATTALLATPAKMAIGNAVQGGVGQAGTDLTGDPLVGAAAGIGTGIATALPAAAIRSIARPMLSGSHEAIVGERLENAIAAGAKGQDRADRINDVKSKLDAYQPNVAGSELLTGQATGNLPILQAERAARTADNTPFNEREAEQNNARLAALRSSGNQRTGKPLVASQLFQSHLEEIDRATQEAVDRLTASAKAKAQALGPSVNPDDLGEGLRRSIEATRLASKVHRGLLYDAVDPEGKVSVTATPVRGRADDVLGNTSQWGPPVEGEEARIFAKAQSMPDTMKFNDLRAFETDVTQAMAKERMANGESASWGRLAQLKAAALDAVNKGVENQEASEQRAVAAGKLSPEQTVEARLKDTFNSYAPADRQADAGTMAEGAGAVSSRTSRRAASAKAGAPGAGSEAAGTSRGAPGDQGVSGQASSATDPFLEHRAAIQKQVHEDLLAAGRAGETIGGARASAIAEHYVQRAQRAAERVPVASVAETNPYMSYARERGIPGQLDVTPSNLQFGADLYRGEPAAAKAAATPAHAPAAAPVTPATKGAFSPTRAKTPPPQTSVPADNAAERLRQAKTVAQDYARTYKEGAVAPVIATRGFGDNYKLPAGAVPEKAFIPGAKGYENVKAFLKAAGNRPEAVDMLRDAALNPLRAKLTNDGAIDPKAFAAWHGKYEQSIRALDEADPGFSGRVSDAAKATEEMMAAGADREARLADFEKSAAAGFLNDDKTLPPSQRGLKSPVEVENVMGKVLSAKMEGPTQAKALVDALRPTGGGAPNAKAIAGLRRAGIDWMTRNFTTATEAGTSGEKQMAGAAFQKFLKNNRETLKALYPKDHLEIMDAVAKDMEMANRSIQATAMKGGPGTAKDVAPMFKKATEQIKRHTSILGAIATGTIAGHELGFGAPGAAIGGLTAGGAYLLGTLRSAGIHRVDQLYVDALMNPTRAKLYLSKVPERQEGALYGLSRLIRRQLAAAPSWQTGGGR